MEKNLKEIGKMIKEYNILGQKKLLTEYEYKQEIQKLQLKKDDFDELSEMVNHQINYWQNQFDESDDEYIKSDAERNYKHYCKLLLKVEFLKRSKENDDELDHD